MAWGETKAWLKGTTSGKLYQDLLDDATKVEVDNDGKSMMNSQQFSAVQSLFRWVAHRYGIPFQLATGCLFPKNSHFDDTTTKVCSWAGAKTTTDPYVACMSRGLSCHWWLEANKNNNSHACPGPGILKQLHNVVGR